MKRYRLFAMLLTLCLTLSAIPATAELLPKAGGVKINAKNFPDARFRKIVSSRYDKNNKLSALDVSKNTRLVSLSCSGNKALAKLKLNKRLIQLSCSEIPALKRLDLTDTALGAKLKSAKFAPFWDPISDGASVSWMEWQNLPDGYHLSTDPVTKVVCGGKTLYKRVKTESIVVKLSTSMYENSFKKGNAITIKKGKRAYVRLTPKPAGATADFTWTSDNGCVRIDSFSRGDLEFELYGKEKGVATVTIVSADGAKATVKVTVK